MRPSLKLENGSYGERHHRNRQKGQKAGMLVTREKAPTPRQLHPLPISREGNNGFIRVDNFSKISLE